MRHANLELAACPLARGARAVLVPCVRRVVSGKAVGFVAAAAAGEGLGAGVDLGLLHHVRGGGEVDGPRCGARVAGRRVERRLREAAVGIGIGALKLRGMGEVHRFVVHDEICVGAAVDALRPRVIILAPVRQPATN